MKSSQIRSKFLAFFEARGHTIVPSSSLVPAQDPTLLFTSAGMVPFKPYFMGLAEPPARRITGVQKCFRTSDIDSVGDGSHLTFFEMLGNFSVGDYFKAEAIGWAWELVTKEMGLPPERLWTAVFQDDDEAFDLWRKQGVPPERIRRYGEEENYWFSGDIGPCGPCSEIFFDFGEETGCQQADCNPAHDCGRFLEIWNLVFMTYFQQEDGARVELPTKNIDTGAGLERWAVVQLFLSPEWQQRPEPPTVYDTDLFRPIIDKVAELAGRDYESADEQTKRAMRIVAEHARAAAFLIADGVLPSNEGRGYVLRRLLRRAVYHARTKFISNREYLDPLVRSVGGLMSEAYPELHQQAALLASAVREEEERFMETLGRGRAAIEALAEFGRLLRRTFKTAATDSRARFNWASRERPLSGLSSGAFPEALKAPFLRRYDEILGDQPWNATPDVLGRAASLVPTLDGETAFVLWDTFGFPLELAKEVAEEHGLAVDVAGFERLLEAQRERSRAAAQFKLSGERIQAYASLAHVRPRFVGYDRLRHEGTIAGIVGPEGAVESIQVGQEAEVVLHETPFYPEAGGQVGDTGEIVGPNGRFAVEDTQTVAEGLIVHRGRVTDGRLAVDDAVVGQVDEATRRATMRNHTATHLLHRALRAVLGPQAKQAGSLVAPDRLRFDFLHGKPLTEEELRETERIVREQILLNRPVRTDLLPLQAALDLGADAMFDEKYGEEARVVSVGDGEALRPGSGQAFSRELCGGTHCHATGEIGAFFIVDQRSVGAGVRRIDAVTGSGAFEWMDTRRHVVEQLSREYNVPVEELPERLRALSASGGRAREQPKPALSNLPDPGELIERAEKRDGTLLIVEWVDAADQESLRALGDELRRRAKSAAIVLGSVVDDKVSMAVMLTTDLVQKGMHAGKLAQQIGKEMGAGGGGRPDIATAGGDLERREAGFAKARELLTA